MSRLDTVRNQATRRAIRVRKVTRGSSERPRLSVAISNSHVSVQIIDDQNHKTLAASTSVNQKSAGKTMSEKATWVGKDIATKAKKAKVTKVSFDRGSKLYHGRVKALAEAAREEGLEF